MYDAIVVGSGFGGAVSACRLVQAGLSVAIVERGKRYSRGGFPRDWAPPFAGFLYQQDRGIYDVKPIEEMIIVEAAGWGGGSLVYANVQLRCPPDVFTTDNGWPAAYSRAALDPYYDLVAYMLDVKPVQPGALSPGEPPALPPKTRAMMDVAKKLGRERQFLLPNLAVNFGAQTPPAPNKFGVPQSGCSYCGECVVGCQTHAKNTLDLNYLARAETPHAGETAATVFTESEVTSITPQTDGTWEVTWNDHAGNKKVTARARAVVLCAGAVNTTALLLACRKQAAAPLAKLSPALGAHYSGNGDFLGFSYNGSTPFDASIGPTITSGIVYDAPGERDERTWFILEEGGFPKEIARLVSLMNPHGGSALAPDALADDIRTLAESEATRTLALEPRIDPATAIFLSMGRDRANGSIELTGPEDSVRVVWDTPSNRLLYDTEGRLNTDVAHALGADVAFPPTWKLLHKPISVHNLGGCVMADAPADGVVNADGAVFGYAGLFVMDGAALPSSTGVNPSHTIAAVAERNIEIAIRDFFGKPGWVAPERAKAPKIVEPLDAITVPSAPPVTESVGIRFHETMRGFLQPGAFPSTPAIADYEVAFAAAKATGQPAEMTLDITVPDLDRFVADKNHAAIAQGTVTSSAADGAVASGVFNLFSPGDSEYARRMLYALPFWGKDGRPYLLDGWKDVRDHGDHDVLAATTTLYTAIRAGHARTGEIVALGVLHLDAVDLAKQVASMEALGAQGLFARAEAVLRFGKMFLGTLWSVFVRPRL